MSATDTPKDGDYSKLIEKKLKQGASANLFATQKTPTADVEDEEDESLDDQGDLSDLELDDMDFEPISDEELEQQALAHGGLDDDPTTPE